MMIQIKSFMAALGLVLAGSAHGEVSTFFDRTEWDAAVGPVTTLDFTGFPNGTFITDQYADLGATFTDGDDSVFVNPSFVNDGVGLDGNGNISVAFDTPQLWTAVDYPGFIMIRLFLDQVMVYEGIFGDPGQGWFVGLVSTDPFDSIVLIDPGPGGEAEVDDLHFGVPAPATLMLFGLAALATRRRRPLPAS
ncbi:MAG: PEP-CTERM sorting domain-containing protein [Planctomycetota bacterium]|jgi:hypothetical protein